MIELLMQAVVSLMATIAFALLFHAPRKQYLWCGITGMAGWLVYWVLEQQPQISAAAASFAGALTLTLVTRVLSVVCKMPSAVYITPGIFPLVPGAGIYDTVYYFILGMNDQALAKGAQTMKISVAIALGIVLVLALPARCFHGRALIALRDRWTKG